MNLGALRKHAGFKEKNKAESIKNKKMMMFK